MDEITLMDYDFNPILIFDEYESIIWNESFYEIGDFELYLRADKIDINSIINVKSTYFLSWSKSDRFMVVEKIETEESEDGNDHYILSGKSMEILLNRRISHYNFTFSGQYTYYGLLEWFILITNNYYNNIQLFSNRKLIATYNDESINDVVTRYDFSWVIDGNSGTLLDNVQYLCANAGFGYKMYLGDDGNVYIEFMINIDRSTEQNTYTPVIFSKKFDNLLSIKYKKDFTNWKNDGWCDIQTANGVQSYIRYPIYNIPPYNAKYTGVERREIYITTNYEYDNSLKANFPYYTQNDQSSATLQYMRSYAQLNLTYNHSYEESVEFEINPYNEMFKYKKDYNLGDIVSIESDIGLSFKAYCSSVTYSINSSDGATIIPKFEVY